MSLKHKTYNNIEAAGLDQRYKGEIGKADSISNFRRDPEGGGWLSDRGIEPWWNPGTSTFNFPITGADPFLSEKIDSIYVWTKQNGEQTYILIEQAGVLYYLWGNKKGTAASDFFRDRIILDTGRHIPKANEAGTQYIPYGNRLLIINGVDKPILFYGGSKKREFGFTLPTPQPELLGIQADYLAGIRLQDGVACPNFQASESYIGLGDIDTDDISSYSYKVSMIMDTGSESPLSSSATVSWTIPSDGDAHRKFGVAIKGLPVGKEGCVARRIYRTKNQRDSSKTTAQSGIFYFAKQINDNSTDFIIDITPDQSLVNEATPSQDSTVCELGYNYGTTWNGRLWLAGGSSHPTKIIYSEKGFCEQFGTFNFFEVGTSKGGQITALTAYYNNLLVFRESSIEVIRAEQSGLFTISQLSPTIGTCATNTIRLVPEVGVIFLTKDGFYNISGGLDGGSQVQITKISANLTKEVQRINVSALPRAYAAYSPKEKEYWCHYVPAGQTIPCRGLVLHLDNLEWSQRKASDKTLDYLFYFTCLAVDEMGNFLLGTKPTWMLDDGSISDPTVLNANGYLTNLHVWSGAGSWGNRVRLTAKGQNSWTYSLTPRPLFENSWESNWIDFEDNSIKHRVFSVEAEIITFGDNLLFLDWGFDHDFTWNSAGGQKMAKPETVFTTSEDAVLGPQNSAISKSYFTIGQTILSDQKVTRLRWDVNTKLVDTFRFRLRSTGYQFQVLSYHINFDSRDQAPLNQKATGARSSQPY